MSDSIKVKLVQKRHEGDFPYYVGTGRYFGVQFEQVGDDLVATVDPDDVESLIKAKKVKKLSANACKELVQDAKETD